MRALGHDDAGGTGASLEARRVQTWCVQLQLTAVHPVCLQAHPETPQQQQQPAAGQGAVAEQWPPAPGDDPAAAAAAADLPHHQLLLHLEAVLEEAPGVPPPVEDLDGGGGFMPLPADRAVLQLVLLNRGMQVLLHRQVGLLELLQQQQVLAAAPHTTSSSTSSSSRASTSTRSSVSSEDGPSTRRAVQLHVHLSAPCQPSGRALDFVHLLITLSASQLLSADDTDTAAHQPACLVAELPLLVIPAAAHQEVQQRLLPAMRQDVQAELQLQQQDEGDAGQLACDPAALAWQSMQVERTAWQHFKQLALDMLLVLQLAEAAAAEAEQAAEEAAASSAAAAAAAAPAAGMDAAEPATTPPPCHAAAGTAGEEPTAAGEAGARSIPQPSPSMRALAEARNTLLLPLLLPFLTAHGMLHTLAVLLQCLPPQLQLDWSGEQQARLAQLTEPPATAAAATAAAASAAAASVAAAAAAAAAAAVTAPTETTSSVPLPATQGTGGAEAAAARSSAASVASASGGGSGSGSGGLPVFVTSAMLDTAVAAAAHPALAPAAVDVPLLRAGSSTSGSVFESVRSSPPDWDLADWGVSLEQQPDQQHHHHHQQHKRVQQQKQQQELPPQQQQQEQCLGAPRGQLTAASSVPLGTVPEGGASTSRDVSRRRSSSCSCSSNKHKNSFGHGHGGVMRPNGAGSPDLNSPAGTARPHSGAPGHGAMATAAAAATTRPAAAAAAAAAGQSAVPGPPTGPPTRGSASGSTNASGSGSTLQRLSTVGSSLTSVDAVGALAAAAGVPCWLLPFRQFDAPVEKGYLSWKHQQLLYLDVLGGAYTLALAAALTKPALLQHPATPLLLAMTLVKALPHLPLLLGFRKHHVRYRELWMFLGAPCCALLLCASALAAGAWPPPAMPPPPQGYRAFWRMHGELLTAGLRAFFQHMRLRPFLLYAVLNALVCVHVWAPWAGMLAAAERAACAAVAALVVCWGLEVCMRRRFLLLLQEQQQRQQQHQHRHGW